MSLNFKSFSFDMISFKRTILKRCENYKHRARLSNCRSKTKKKSIQFHKGGLLYKKTLNKKNIGKEMKME